MASITCPNCNQHTERGDVSAWIIIVAIIIFPIGLFAFFSDSKPTKCATCNHIWLAKKP